MKFFVQRMLLATTALCLLAGSAFAQVPFLQHKSDDYRTWGSISRFHLNVPMQPVAPVTSLDKLPYKDFTYSLYPTGGSGAGGMVPGDVVSGKPTMLTVANGSYDHTNDPDRPLGYEVFRTDLADLPKAPGGKALLVYGVLYSGDHSSYCTGIVQVLELTKQGQLMLSDQISYDCRGGASAEYEPAKHRLTVRSARYAAGDQPCCPSLFDTVEFKLDGESVKAGNVTIP